MRWLLISVLIVISFNTAGQQYYETYTPSRMAMKNLWFPTKVFIVIQTGNSEE